MRHIGVDSGYLSNQYNAREENRVTSPLGSKKNRLAPKAKINQHERDIAAQLPDAVRQPMSGALPGKPGDVKLERFLLDSKETETKSLILTYQDFVKLTAEAKSIDKIPGFVITLQGLPVYSEWVAIPLSVFAKMIEAGQDKDVLELE